MTEPIVIGHRGAAGYRPEHTLASYRLAIRLGADYVEPDLVSTEDGVLVARHENEIGGTTDVAEHRDFAGRQTTKVIDGRLVTGWFTEDFTLAELKTLRAKERLPLARPDNTRYDGMFEIPTFDEVLELVGVEERRSGRRIGIYPETKHPSYFAGLGLALEEPLMLALRRAGLDRPGSRVFIQSFETDNLRHLAGWTGVPRVQLLAATGAPYDLVRAGDPRCYCDLTTDEGLADVATYADAVGVEKTLVLAGAELSDLVPRAHGAGLRVHVWTLRDENQFVAAQYRRGDDPSAKGDAYREARTFLDAGVDGIFADHPDTAVMAVEDWLAAADRPA